MVHGCSLPSRDKAHGELAISLQASLSTATEVIPVFTTALARTSLLRSGLSLLQLKLIGLSNPPELLALKTPILTKLSGCLQELLRQLDSLVDKKVQNKVQYFHGIIRQRIDSLLDDGQRTKRHFESAPEGEETSGEQHGQQKGRNARCNHPNLEALQTMLAFGCLLESEDTVISSEYHQTLSTVTNGSVVDLDRAAQNETRILESCEVCQLAIDKAWPESTADIGDLVMAKDADRDQVDEVLVRVEDAKRLCSRLEMIYELLSQKLHGCRSTKHVAKFHLSGLGGGTIGFLFSGCYQTQGWYPMPCRIHQSVTPLSLKTQRLLTYYMRSDTGGMLPFRGCRDFRIAEALNECLTLNLGNDQNIFTQSIPKSSELEREYGTIPERFLTLNQVLNANTSDQTGRAMMEPGMIRKFYTRFVATVLRTPRQEPNDAESDYISALTKNVAMVQYLLSESVLHLYKSSWLVDIWQPDHIEFAADGTLLDFRRPFYSSPLLIDSSEELILDQIAGMDPYDHAETFMAKFGLLLLQLQVRQHFPLEDEDQTDDIWPSIALCWYYGEYKESVQPIKEVVSACLNFRRHLFEDLDARGKSDTLRFRMVFYKRILMPLRAVLLLNCPEVAIEIQNNFVRNAFPEEEHMEATDNQPGEAPPPMGHNGGYSGVAPHPHIVGEVMLNRRGAASSTEWFNKFNDLNEYLTAHTCESNETYEANRVKVAVIDSGLREERQRDAHICYQNFIETWNDAHRDNPQHGTNSVNLVRKVYGRADIYVAKVFQGDEADGNTSKYMAKAIRWAISKKVDIISISAGFKDECHDELEAQIKMATAEGEAPEILVFAAASNWQNINGVAYPASMTDRVIGIFCCNGGLKNSRQWNPNPRNHAANFAMLGEDVVLDSGMRLIGGTSVSTALAAGLAAKLLDFSRQPDVQSWMSRASRDKMRTKAGMSAILKEMSRKNVSEGYECVAPWEILPDNADSGSATREKVREDVCTIIKKAMKKA
ncbi:hypothetical protein NCS52_00275600 [Fusarium sp. LHS14.1]|nr:hypothetical protein NCS52_00275600 [Fusarium sp. LHS14.1]